jgi:hypothetical protein
MFVELSRDVHKARTALRQIVGNEIPVVPPAATGERHLSRADKTGARSAFCA